MTAAFPLTLSEVLVRRQGKVVLGPVSLTVAPGGPLMIVGPNGAGKSTLLRVMHGIERVSRGSMTWQLADQSQHAFVFQQPIVLRRSVAENLVYPLRLIGVPMAEARARAIDWAGRIGLADSAATQALLLSGGQKQKLAIARALIRRPDVLFLDEPCANLDGHATREIEELLLEAAGQGTQIVMATHNMGQARRLAGTVVFMLNGRVHESGLASLLDAPVTTQMQAFVRGDIVT